MEMVSKFKKNPPYLRDWVHKPENDYVASDNKDDDVKFPFHNDGPPQVRADDMVRLVAAQDIPGLPFPLVERFWCVLGFHKRT